MCMLEGTKEMRYTFETHYKALKKFLAMIKGKEKHIDSHCPLEFDKLSEKNGYESPYVNDECAVCRKFIKLRKVKHLEFDPEDGRPISTYTVKCPCLVLGHEEAYKRTVKAVKEFEKNFIK